MAQKDSQLVIRARDEASKALQAITKSVAEFVGAQLDATKTAGATSGTLAKLGQSINDLGRSATNLNSVGKIAEQLDKGQKSVGALEAKLAQAANEFTDFQARATQAAAATTALSAQADTAASVEKAQAAVVKALAEAHAKNAREIKGEEEALEKLAGRLVKAGTTAAPQMAQDLQSRRAALDAQKNQQAQAAEALAKERAELERLAAAREGANKALVAAEREEGRFAASVKASAFNVENLTVGLERSRGVLGEIKTIFAEAAQKAGLSAASVETLAEAQGRLKIATEAATAAIATQNRAETVSIETATRAATFAGSLKAAVVRPAANDAANAVAATRGALAKEADRQRAATDAAASAEAREKVQLDALGRALDAVSRSRQAQRTSPGGVSPPTPGGSATPGNAPLGVAAPAQAAATAYRQQIQAVDAAARSYSAASVRLEELHRSMAGVTQPTIEQTAALNTQKVITEAAKAALETETKQLDAFRQAIRAAAVVRAEAADRAARAAIPPPPPPPPPGPSAQTQTAARLAAVSRVAPAAAPIESNEAVERASVAYRAQVAAVAELARAYASASEKLKNMKAEAAAWGGASSTFAAEIEAQRVAVDSARAAIERETVALRALRAAASEAGTAAAPAAAPQSSAATAQAALREQIRAVQAAKTTFAQENSRLAVAQMGATTSATAEQTAALAAQRSAWESARETMQREVAALQTMREAIAQVTRARREEAEAARARSAGLAAVGGVVEEAGQLNLLQRVMAGITSARRAYNATIAEGEPQHNALIANLKNLAGAYATVFTAIQAFKSIVTTAADTEAAQVRIATALGGSQEQGAIAYEHAANAARALRLDILPTVDAYGKLLAVVKDTPLEGRAATKVFDDLLVTIRAFKLAPDAMQRVTLALTDMAARGNIARKELNQLDLALPVGLRQALASAAGYGANQMQEFNKAIHDGKIGLDLLEPALEIVANRARGGLGEALNTAQSSFAAFRNALFDFQNSIAEGGFLKGITEGVNAFSAVLRDPAASEGLRGIAAGLGRVIALAGALVPYARELFVALSAFTAVKLTSMVFGFQTLYQVGVSVVGLFSGLGRVFATGLLGFGAALTGVEGGLLAVGTALTGPVGIAAAVAVIGGGIALWLTGTKSAEEGLASYKRTLDSIKGSLQESGGDATRLGKDVGGLTVSEIETELTAQKRYFDQTSASVDSLGRKVQTVGAGLALSSQADPVLVKELAQLGELFAQYKKGGETTAQFQSKIEDLNKSLTNSEVKTFAAQISEAAGKEIIFSSNVDVLEGALLKAGVKLDLTAAQADKARAAFNKMWEDASKNDTALAALDKYAQAMDTLAGKIPALKAELDLKTAVDDAKKELQIGLTAVDEQFRRGEISEQQAAGRRADIIKREALAESEAQAKNYARQSSRPDQQNEAYQFLSENKAGNYVNTNNLAPDYAVALTAAIKELQAESVPIKVASGYRDPDYLRRTGQGTPEAQEYDASGKSLHTAGIASDWEAAGVTAGSAMAKHITEVFEKHGVYNPYGYSNPDEFNHVQALPEKNLPQSVVDEMNLARSRGAPLSSVQSLALPQGQLKKTLDSANADRSKDANDAIKAQEAIDKQLESARELLQTETARASVDRGLADFRKNFPGATQDQINAEKKLLIEKQAELEVTNAVAKFKNDNPTATAKEVLAYRDLQIQIRQVTASRKEENTAARDAAKTASAELSSLNSLVTERNRLLKEKSFATETGDEDKLNTVNAALETNKSKIQEVTAELRKYYETLGGEEGQKGINRLNAISAGFDSARTKVQIFGLSVSQTKELANDFVSDVTSGIDTFAQEIADGVKPIQALGDAFRKFASDFLRQIAEMIIKAQLFKLLGMTAGGDLTGGGLLGGLSGASSSAASGASGGGVSSIFGFLGSLFGAHKVGGIVGAPLMTERVSPLVFAGAAHYATGGIVGLAPDAVPIIAHRNEEVLTTADPRHRDNGGMAVQNVVKQPKIVNLFDASSFLSVALATPEGERAIMNFVRANPGAVKSALGG